MKDMGIIEVSAAQATNIVVGANTVYIHTDITPTENKNVFTCHEVQYTKKEYLEIMNERERQLEERINNTQVALTELYEGAMMKEQ